MKALIITKQNSAYKNPLALVELPKPYPKDNEILIKISYCALCHTDLHIVEGELKLKRSPLVLGHQIIGIVESKGKNTGKLNVGDKVGVAWLNSTCGDCYFCKTGRENLCLKAKFTGYNVNGGFAEYITIGEDYAYSMPGGLSDVEAAPLLCAGIIGYRAFKLTGLKRGGKLGIYGFGASAHVTIQLATYCDVDAYVFSRGIEHRRLAKRLGAIWTGGYDDGTGLKMDGSIIFSPSGSVVPIALENLQYGGTVVIAGIHMTDIPVLNYERHLFHEKILRTVTASTRNDGKELISLALKIPIRTEIQLFELDEANEALVMLKKRKINGSAVLKIG